MADSPHLSLRHNPRVGFVATTAALVALATGGTSLLLSQGARQLQPPESRAVTPRVPSPPSAPVVVQRAPGSLVVPPVAGPPRVVAVAAPPVAGLGPDRPAVPVGPVAEPPVEPPVEPPAGPPVAEPQPPVTEPPVVTPPGAEPEERPGRHVRSAKPVRTHPEHPEHPEDRGKHLGQLKH